MKFVDNFYILIIFFTKIIWVITIDESFDDTELSHLAKKLNPIECLRLLESMYVKRPMSDEEFLQSEMRISLNDESILRRQLEIPFFNRDNCRNKLVEWSRNLPQKSNKWARVAVETELRILGRPDLAKYVRKNRRAVRYFNEISRISRNTAKHEISASSIVTKNLQVTESNGATKNPLQETLIQNYRKPDEVKSPSENSNFARRESLLARHQPSTRNSTEIDSKTRWTAFLTLLAVVAMTILSTVVFALYKKNRVKLSKNKNNNIEKCSNDRCPIVDDRYTRKSSIFEIDLEQGATDNATTTTRSPSRCARRRDRRSSSQDKSPRSASSSCCVREEIPPRKKSCTKKCRRTEPPPREQQKTSMPKIPKRGCPKKCSGMKERPLKIDKSTITRERRVSEKSNQSENPPKTIVNLKKFHEKIANILRKDEQSCKCCKCTIFNDDEKYNGTKRTSFTKNKNICMDEKCQKTRLKSIAELCLSPDETSPTDEPETRIKKQKEKKKKHRKKRRKKEKDEDKDTEKDSLKSSPENSARSRDKRESKVSKKKPDKSKKERWTIEEACTRKTCDFGRKNMEEMTNFD